MNSKSTYKPAGRPSARPETQGEGKPTTKGKSLRPGEKVAPSEGYGVYREATPVKVVPPPVGRAPAAPALAEALRAVAADLKALKNEVAQRDAEIKALQKRVTQMEARQKSQEKAFRAQQYPSGATAPASVVEQPDGKGTVEEETA